MNEEASKSKRVLGRDEPGVFDHNLETSGSVKAYGKGLNQFSGPLSCESWLEIPHRSTDPTAWDVNERGRCFFHTDTGSFKFWDGTRFLGLVAGPTSMFTEGAIPFGASGGELTEDATNLVWNDALNVLEVLAGTLNTYIGKGVIGAGTSTGVRNVFLGYEAGRNNAGGGRNVFLGYWAGYGATFETPVSGSYNTLVGYYASNYLTTGYSNTCVGAYAGQTISGGYRNTCVGTDAGKFITAGYENVIVGKGAASSLTTGFRNTCVGLDANVDAVGAQYRITIGYGALSKENNLCAIGGMGAATSVHLAIFENREFRWYDNSNYIGFEAPALTANQIWVLPDADADAANMCLQSDAAGNLGWSQALGVTDAPTFLGAVLGGDTNYATFDADGKLTLTGSARVTKFIVLSTSFLERGSTAPDVAYTGNYLSWSYDIGDDSVMTHLVPNDWASGTDIIVKVHWFINEAYASDKEVKWQCLWSLCPHGNSEAIDAPTHSGTLTGSSTNIPATAKFLVETTVGTIAGASIAVEDEIGLVLSRLAADADDPTADPQVVHLELVYTANKLGAAT